MYNWYSSAYHLINEYMFANTVVEGSYEDLMVSVLSFIMVLFAVAIPFVFIAWLIKKVFSIAFDSWR